MPQQELVLPQKQEQFIQEEQSFAFAQILLQATVAKIAYLRELLPDECFEDRDAASIHHGSDYLHGEPVRNGDGIHTSEIDLKETACGRVVTVLARSTIPGAGVNRILDWLDIVFVGLRDHTLDGFRLCIYADRAKPFNVLETYTFSFRGISNAGSAQQQLVGMAHSSSGRGTKLKLDRPGDASIFIGDAWSNLQTFMRGLHDFHQTLPDLPMERYLACHLLRPLDDTTSPAPPGFQNYSAPPEFFFPLDRFWQREAHDYGSSDLGSYSVGLVASQMAVRDTGGGDSYEYRIPDSLNYREGCHGRFDLKHVRAPRIPVTSKRSHKHSKDANLNVLSRPLPDVGEGHRSGLTERDTSKGQKRGRKISDTAHTQRPARSSSGSSLVPTQVLDSDAVRPPNLRALKLLPGKALRMEAKREHLGQQEAQVVNGQDIIRCQCGYAEEEGVMMRCNCCDTWQHYHCYGFLRERPGKEHFCYQCLLEDSDKPRLDDLRRLAQFRRALFILYETEPESQSAFMESLGFDARAMRELFRRLKNEGFLNKRPGTALSLVKTAEQQSIQQRAYFNPMTYIDHQYEPAPTLASPTDQTESQNPRRKRVRVKQ